MTNPTGVIAIIAIVIVAVIAWKVSGAGSEIITRLPAGEPGPGGACQGRRFSR